MQVPGVLYMMLPIIVFSSCLIGVGKLANSSEITVMRASGVSIYQITWLSLKAIFIVVVCFTVFGETLAPKLQNQAEIMKFKALNEKSPLIAQNQIWMHKNHQYIHISSGAMFHILSKITKCKTHYKIIGIYCLKETIFKISKKYEKTSLVFFPRKFLISNRLPMLAWQGILKKQCIIGQTLCT